MLAGVVATRVDENVSAVVGRTNAKSVGAIVTNEFGQPHAELGPEPPCRVRFAGRNMKMRPRPVESDKRNRMGVLEDLVDALRRPLERGRFEDLTDLEAFLEKYGR